MRRVEYTPVVRQYITASGSWVELITLDSFVVEFASDVGKEDKLRVSRVIVRDILSNKFLQNMITGGIVITDVSHGPIQINFRMKSAPDEKDLVSIENNK